MSIPSSSSSGLWKSLCCTSRNIFGGFPSNKDKGISTGMLTLSASPTNKSCRSVTSPTMAQGQRSRSAIALKISTSSWVTPSTYRSCDSLHQISIGDILGSSFGTRRKSKRPPRPLSFTSSGKALDNPPAPTS